MQAHPLRRRLHLERHALIVHGRRELLPIFSPNNLLRAAGPNDAVLIGVIPNRDVHVHVQIKKHLYPELVTWQPPHQDLLLLANEDGRDLSFFEQEVVLLALRHEQGCLVLVVSASALPSHRGEGQHHSAKSHEAAR